MTSFEWPVFNATYYCDELIEKLRVSLLSATAVFFVSIAFPISSFAQEYEGNKELSSFKEHVDEISGVRENLLSKKDLALETCK